MIKVGGLPDLLCSLGNPSTVFAIGFEYGIFG